MGKPSCTHPAVLEDVVNPVGESLFLHPCVPRLQLVNMAHLVGRVHGRTGLGEPQALWLIFCFRCPVTPRTAGNCGADQPSGL